MSVKKPADFGAGVLFLCLGIGAFLMAQDYSIGTSRQMGPGYFPAALGSILSFLGLMQIALAFGGARQGFGGIALRPLLMILLAAASFGLLLRPAGLIVAILVAVMLASFAGKESKWWQSLILGAALAAGSALVFVHYLGQPLPLLGYWF